MKNVASTSRLRSCSSSLHHWLDADAPAGGRGYGVHRKVAAQGQTVWLDTEHRFRQLIYVQVLQRGLYAASSHILCCHYYLQTLLIVSGF